ncbi:ATP-binding cassette domain-containing protein [Microbacterium sp.]|uniref:ATP-binding cassette domain-containing protein n=1 Tax=Microbacterium sp. TaxID=51671 RepID=UPI0039E27D52
MGTSPARPRLRRGPLRAAAALALGFVAVRVLYRVLFHGADGSGQVLLPLPSWRMPPPLAHVVLLGPVTADGLGTAVLSAAPIALTILAFGVLNALLDVPRLIARAARRGPLQGLARAVSIAWATLPSLAAAVQSVRFAQRLRGEHGGVRLLAPVLEHTLERATAVAAALELRGYAGRGREGACERPVELDRFAAGFGAAPVDAHPDARATGLLATSVVSTASLRLQPGTLTVLTGPTGSGKSTLLRALSGLHTHLDGGWLTGDAQVVGHDRAATPPRDLSRTVGVVLQHPRQAFATQRVADEIGLALELRGAAPALVAARVAEAAERAGIAPLRGRGLRGLSAGEATLVAIAAAIVEQPILLLVDEPLADLDVAARARIVDLLHALAHERGVCVLVAEHHAAGFAGVADRWLEMDAGAVVDVDPEHLRGLIPAAASLRTRHDPRGVPERAPALVATGITVRHGDRVAVDDAAVALHLGEVVALQGPNGAGKSSLLVALATGEHAARAALVPDDSDALFVRDTVAAECRRADRMAKRLPGAAGAAERRSAAWDGSAPTTPVSEATAVRLAELLDLDPAGREFAALLRRHPRDLSAGQRRCLAIAVQTARAPRTLLLDEPTRGLDPSARALVASALARQAASGTAVLFATHDAEFAAALADRTLAMDAGILASHPHPHPHSHPDSHPDPHPRETSQMSAKTAEMATFGRFREVGGSEAGRSGAGQHEAGQHEAGQRGAGDELDVSRPEPGAAPSMVQARRRWRTPALIAANIAAASAFLWPLVASAVPAQAQAAVPYIALALAPLAVVLVLAALDVSVRSAHTLALLAVLAAIGAAIRIASTGVGGVEALFVLLILAGRAYGARFGLLLGAASIALSAIVWGGVGPWLPFQMFACGWVGAGAGLLPRRVSGWAEIGMLAVYGIASAYLFGMIMNMWFWPFAVGADTSISYVPGGSIAENLGNFVVYSLLTSTLSWDTLRAVTTVVGLVLVGRALLRSLRRAKPVAPARATVDT